MDDVRPGGVSCPRRADRSAVDRDRMTLERMSVRQPVILVGYPTSGCPSLNNRAYRYLQMEDRGGQDLRHYNRYFVRYAQPPFQPTLLA